MADITVTAEPIEITTDDGIVVYIGGTATVTGELSGEPSGGAGGFLSGSYPNPGVNTEALQDAVGAMAGDGMTYDDAAGELNAIAPPHSIAWCLVPDTFDPTTTPTIIGPTTNLYIYTGVEADTYEHAGLWVGTSDGVTPGLMERHPHTVTTGDMYTSRTFIDARGGIDGDGLPIAGVGDPTVTEWPGSLTLPRRVDAIISGNNGPNLPVWSQVMEFDHAGGGDVGPTLGELHDVDTTTVAPTDGQALVWDDGDSLWKPGTVSGGGGTVDVVSNVAASTILGRVTAGSGDSEELTATQVRTLLNVADGATAYTDEQARDAVGAALAAAAGSGLSWSVNDGADTITIDQSPTAIAGQDEGTAVTATSATTLLDSTFAVGSSLMSPGDSIQVVAWCDVLNNSGSSKSETIVVVWGNLTLTLASPAIATSATARPARVQIDARMESTSSVNVSAIFTINNAAASIAHGECTSDHTGTVTLDVKGQVTTGGNQSITLSSVTVRHDRA